MKKIQAALALLYTHKTTRQAFYQNDFSPLQHLNLSSQDINYLKQIPQNQLEEFAQSLIAKRRQNAENLLPIIKFKLKDKFNHYFEQYAANQLPDHKHGNPYRRDAFLFTQYLLKKALEHPIDTFLEYELQLQSLRLKAYRTGIYCQRLNKSKMGIMIVFLNKRWLFFC